MVNNNRGFTLIEILVVVIILGIFIGLVSSRIMDKPEEARRTKTKLQIENLSATLDQYYLDTGYYPSTEQGLEALVEKPTVGRIPKKYREGGYLKGGKVPLDPWSNRYVYLSPGVNSKEFDLESYGADGEDGGEGFDADVESWNLQ
ncbi:MAG: type II secretion system major pseudopilin GspG [Proteobacteria bacterium]|nr:type II secretion system major pseudopilin GspG [Pseudomonadota bacterium]